MAYAVDAEKEAIQKIIAEAVAELTATAEWHESVRVPLIKQLTAAVVTKLIADGGVPQMPDDGPGAGAGPE